MSKKNLHNEVDPFTQWMEENYASEKRRSKRRQHYRENKIEINIRRKDRSEDRKRLKEAQEREKSRKYQGTLDL